MKKVAPKKKPAVKKASTRAKKIDWDMAFQYYCEDMTRTYEDVAKKFGVGVTAIYQHSKKEDTPWTERRLAVIEKAQKRAAKRRYRDVTDRDDVHLKSFRAAITAHTNTIIREGNKNEKGDITAMTTSTNALYKAVMGERVILGLPILIARSEITQDDEEVETPADVMESAKLLAEHVERLEKYRNNG